jgi:hypothetical protein
MKLVEFTPEELSRWWSGRHVGGKSVFINPSSVDSVEEYSDFTTVNVARNHYPLVLPVSVVRERLGI